MHSTSASQHSCCVPVMHGMMQLPCNAAWTLQGQQTDTMWICNPRNSGIECAMIPCQFATKACCLLLDECHFTYFETKFKCKVRARQMPGRQM